MLQHNVICHKEDAMKLWRRVATIVMLFVSPLVFAGDCDHCVCKGKDTAKDCTACCQSAQQLGLNPTQLELRISDDGRAIVDQDGKEVARFAEGISVQIVTKGLKTPNQKLQGCWHCYPVCVVWDGNRCVQWERTCDWVFDCK